MDKMNKYGNKRVFSGYPIYRNRFRVCFLLLFLWAAGPAAAGESGTGIRGIGEIKAGQSLYTCLCGKGVPSKIIKRIIAGLKPHLDFRRIHSGTPYWFVLDPVGRLREFAIRDRKKVLLLTAGPNGQDSVQCAPYKLQTGTFLVSGVCESSLMQAFKESGEADTLAEIFQEILSTDLDPPFPVKPGDRFVLIVEKEYVLGRLIRYGSIPAFEIRRGNVRFQAFGYKGRYYDRQGVCRQRLFLRVPLHYQFVSSGFMEERRHPILGGVRPHRGIDLAAPVGTPVWTIADGVVDFAGWLNGYGRTVLVRHDYGYRTLYGHLQSFADKIEPGAVVSRKQVIGYIGTTGWSTGPHLHYGLTHNGLDRDPLKEEFPRERISNPGEWHRFRSLRDSMLLFFEAPDAGVKHASPQFESAQKKQRLQERKERKRK